MDCAIRSPSICSHAPRRTLSARLADIGAPFDRTPDGGFAQGLEAAHSRTRVAKVGGDGAGARLWRRCSQPSAPTPSIEVREGVHVRALLQDESGAVRGVRVQTEGGWLDLVAPATLLATGGVGGLYKVTTNPTAARGEGLALAALAGARIEGAEFVQFHPTAIDIDADPAPLATEALRGDGAKLIDRAGRRFMLRYDPAAELAPRDVVARAIAAEIAAGRGAFLDAREAVGDAFPEHFPAVFAACMAAGIDPRVQPIPIAPAAHYHMGGVVTDLDGADLPAWPVRRRRSRQHRRPRREPAGVELPGGSGRVRPPRGRGRRRLRGPWDRAVRRHAYRGLAAPRAMSRYARMMSERVGVVRDANSLRSAIDRIADLQARHGPALALVAAGLIARAALARRESRGGHFRADAPGRRPRGLMEPLPDAADRADRPGRPRRGSRSRGGHHLHSLYPARGADGGRLRRAQARRPGRARLRPLGDGRTGSEGELRGRPRGWRPAFAGGRHRPTERQRARHPVGRTRRAQPMGRLSGIASLTASYVERVAGTRAQIIDTRKTTPGLRLLEKYAVRCGGGANHRFGLDDAVLIKDNHVAACGGVGEAIRRARAHVGHMVKVEAEVDDLAQFDEALAAAPDIVMLDNFSLADLAEAVRRAGGRVVLEASGGVNLETVRGIAETGVDLISVGALTHSAPVLDIGLDAV